MSTPNPSEPAESWAHYHLYRRVIDALYAVPGHFTSRTAIEGIAATDLQTLNTMLGATIEEQVVTTLNRMRPVWDPDEQYLRFSFQRQAQVFPDVLLKADRNGQEIIHWWANVRRTATDASIAIPEGINPYPAKSDAVTDRPARDAGGNFGRLARTGIMDEYIAEILSLPLGGIPAKSWIDFLKQFEQ